ncbi:solute carrier family 23 member 1-like [Littorina saxatilis]
MHREREEAIPLKSRNRDPSDEDDDDVSGDTTTTRAHLQVPAGNRHSNGPSGHNDNGYATSMDDNEVTVTIEVVKPSRLIYKVTDNPPPHMVLLFALQQSLLSVSTALTVSLLVSELICARSDNDIKTRIMSATFLMIGVSTFTMSTLGVRLPIFQGPAMTYIVPLFALTTLPEWQCPAQEDLALHYKNSTMNTTLSMVNGEYLVPRDWINEKIQQSSGSLMAGGLFHMLIGLTGLVGFITRFIGPVTIVPAIVLIGLFIYKVAVRFAQTHWGVAALTTGTAVILALYLAKFSTPVPAWNRQRGFHIKWQPLHQMFAILIAVVVGWLVSWLLTELDVLSAEPGNKQFYARTDTRLDIITQAPWFAVPYPGQFGMPSFHVGAFVSFFIATIMSLLDSLGDYSACARACYVPQPPAFAFNRGIAVEGVMSIISGATGCCHATVSFGGNIGAIGLTKVASRRVFQAIGLLYVLFAVITKVGAVFITIPYCVLGGVQIITSGIFIGVVLSNLQYVDLNSSRNLAIIGMALLLGLMLPYWKEQNPDAIQTGVEDLDRIIGIMISNPVFVGGFVSCFLDNTVPGTLAERGLAKVSPKKKDDDIKQEKNEEISDEFENGYEIYDIPWLPASIKQSAIAKYIPIFPGKSPAKSMTNAPLMAM